MGLRAQLPELWRLRPGGGLEGTPGFQRLRPRVVRSTLSWPVGRLGLTELTVVWHSWGPSALCLGTENGADMAGLLRTVRAWQASARLALRREQGAEAQVGLENSSQILDAKGSPK